MLHGTQTYTALDQPLHLEAQVSPLPLTPVQYRLRLSLQFNTSSKPNLDFAMICTYLSNPNKEVKCVCVCVF